MLRSPLLRSPLFFRLVAVFASSVVALGAQAQTIEPRLRGMTANSYLAPDSLQVLSGWKANALTVLLMSFGNVDDAGREEYLSELNLAMDRLDLLLAEAARLKMRVMVNLYYPPGGFNARVGAGAHRIFTDAWAQQTIIDVWDIIAARYKDNDTIWAFQLVNEPAFFTATPGLKSWNELAQTLAENIRRVDSKHYIVVNPPFGDAAKIKKLKLVTGVSKIIYGVNMYYPFSFTHQRLYGLNKIRKYPFGKANKAALSTFLRPVKQFQARAKTPIHITELSTVRWTPKGSGAKWIKDALSIIEQYKWTWAFHAFREATPWSVEVGDKYGDESAATKPTDRLKALQLFFKKNKKQ